MVVGMITSTSTLLLPLLAWGIFPRPWDFVILGGLNSKITFHFLFNQWYELTPNTLVHNWQIFLFVCALPSLVSGLVLYGMPESPRFLMSQGRNAEALQALQWIYHINTGKPNDTYPVSNIAELI